MLGHDFDLEVLAPVKWQCALSVKLGNWTHLSLPCVLGGEHQNLLSVVILIEAVCSHNSFIDNARFNVHRIN